ncbi:MAG: EAL domain-containing protein [Gammaproteobacteria bacterium]|nr:EAL domain-containing protein [Gammaproteobacteria bacterium]
MTCTTCTSIRRVDPAASRALLSWTLPNLGAHLESVLVALGARVSPESHDVVWVDFAPLSPAAFLAELEERLSSEVLSHCRAALCPAGASLSSLLVSGMRPLSGLIALSRAEWLVDALDNGGLEVHLQPILAAADGRSVYAHECLLRSRDEEGGLVGAPRIFAAAEAADLMFQLDRAARLAAIRSVAERAPEGKVFINFNPTSVYDPAFCLQSTLKAARDSGLSLDRFVFEIVESEEIADVDRLRSILDVYRRAGCGVALDDLGAGFSSLGLLASLRPDYVKFDRQLVHGVADDDFKQVMLRKLLELASDLQIITIGEGVEREADWHFLRDAGVDLVQGFHFARPALEPFVPAA